MKIIFRPLFSFLEWLLTSFTAIVSKRIILDLIMIMMEDLIKLEPML